MTDWQREAISIASLFFAGNLITEVQRIQAITALSGFVAVCAILPWLVVAMATERR